MNPELDRDIQEALARAKENSIPVVEIWLGPWAYSQMEALAGSGGPVERKTLPNDTILTYNGLRLRKMATPGVRVGQTTCQFGPGVT